MSQNPSLCPNPQCGCPVQPADVFCAHCGQALEAVPAPEPPLAMSESPTDFAESQTLITPRAAVAKLGQPFPPAEEAITSVPLAARSTAAPAAPARDEAVPPADSDCADLEVSYNTRCVFVLNMQSTFDFVIRPLADGLTDLFVEVRQDGQVIAKGAPRMLPRRQQVLRLPLNYTPRNTDAGKASFELLVGYRKGPQAFLFGTYQSHAIYSGKEDPRQVCESLVVEVRNNIQQGHAGDLKVDQSFHGLREALRERNTIALDQEFLEIINTHPVWVVLPLAECAADPAGGAGAGRVRQPERLELRSAETGVIHLLRQPSIWIGREKKSEIMARVLSVSGQQVTEESRRLHRYHPKIEWQGNQCQLLDVSFSPEENRVGPSANGVCVDGTRLTSGGEFTFAPGREYRITLVKPEPDRHLGYELSARLWLARELPRLRPGCPDLRAAGDVPACLVLRRLQGPPEAYVLLRTAVSLAWVDSRCGSACLCLRDSVIHFSDGQGCDHLSPGRVVRAGSLDFQVGEPPTV